MFFVCVCLFVCEFSIECFLCVFLMCVCVCLCVCVCV